MRDDKGRFAPGHPGFKPRTVIDVDLMHRALKSAGNITAAARQLGVGRITLWRRAVEAGLL